MSRARIRTEWAFAALLLLAAGACAERDLFDPETGRHERLPVLHLGTGMYSLYEGDHVDVRVDSLRGRSARAELLVLNRERSVVWRSPAVAVADTLAEIPVTALPASVYGDTSLSLSADIEVGDSRIYASEDTAPVLSRDSAALRPVRFYPGAVNALADGLPQAMALDATGGRLFFSMQGRARIGLLDLATGVQADGVDVPDGPVTLRYRGAQLGALVADGTELMVFDAAGSPRLVRRVLLPTLRLEVATLRVAGDSATQPQVDTLRATVRPYGSGLAWGCADAGCTGLAAFTASSLSSGGSSATAVIRQVGATSSPIAAPLVLPAYAAGAVSSDTVPSRVRLFTAGAAGSDSLILDRTGRMRCPAVALGSGPFDVGSGPSAALYAATAGELACGDGTRIIKIDLPADIDPHFSAVARTNLTGEDRIGTLKELKVSPDGRYVLVRGEDRVQVLDADLRLRATLEVPGASAIAWLEGRTPDAAYFAVAAPDGITLYATATRVVVARLPVGPTRENLMALWRSPTEVVAAAAPQNRDGILVARVPLP